METTVSKFIDEESPFTHVTKSFRKAYRRNFCTVFKKLLMKITDKVKATEVVNEYHLKVCEYPYYNKVYPENLLYKMIFYEYIIRLINDGVEYINIEDVQKDLDGVFNNEKTISL